MTLHTYNTDVKLYWFAMLGYALSPGAGVEPCAEDFDVPEPDAQRVRVSAGHYLEGAC